jgi:ABC-2 type transport system ATP-binding protein
VSELAIRTEGVARSYGDVHALNGVDLQISEGEIYGFLGPNGAGKSTLVKVLCTLLNATAGQAWVAGFDVAKQAGEVRLRIGLALQEAALDNVQTGREFLRLQGHLYGLSSADIETRIEQVSYLIDTSAIDRRLGTYSGGMKRRLDLAAALIHNPSVLFLDEPTTGLDPTSRLRVWDEVRRINNELGTTIFLTTQYLEEADALAGRVGIISRGLLVAEGTPAELKRRIGTDLVIAEVAEADVQKAQDAVAGVPGVSGVSVRRNELAISVSDGPSVLGPVAVALNSAGVRAETLTLRTPTLDDVFLELTGGHLEEEEAALIAAEEGASA